MEENKAKKKIIKVSDIIVIIIGIVILICGLSLSKENDKEYWGTQGSGYTTKAEEDDTKMENAIIIVGFVIAGFGIACIIKRVLDNNDSKNKTNKTEKASDDTTSKLKE